MDYIIYHNPRCSKSRTGLKILKDHGIEPVVIEYLKNTPSKSELADVLKKLGKRPEEIIRKNEKIFKENFKGKNYSDDEWLEILVNNPKLIERPIVVRGDKAVVGRPPEAIESLIG